LEESAEAALDGGGMGAGIEAGDVDGAGIRLTEAEDALEERGLAGAIGAEEAEDLTVRDEEIDGVNGGDGAETAGEGGGFDGAGG
jgi:hypothetical protein